MALTATLHLLSTPCCALPSRVSPHLRSIIPKKIPSKHQSAAVYLAGKRRVVVSTYLAVDLAESSER